MRTGTLGTSTAGTILKLLHSQATTNIEAPIVVKHKSEVMVERSHTASRRPKWITRFHFALRTSSLALPKRELLYIGLLGLCAGAVNPPLFAQNPRVSVSVADATCAEAAAALSRASGISVQLPGEGSRAAEPGSVAVEPRASFEWSRSTFAGALRELCERYHVTAVRNGAEGYLLYPAAERSAASMEKPVGLVEQDGLRLQVQSVSVCGSRSVSFSGAAAPEVASGGVRVQLQAQVSDGEGGQIAGVGNVTAVDDRGSRLASPTSGITWPFASAASPQMPDEWSGAVSLSQPDPQARKIASLQGDLLGYRTVRPLRIEVPLPLAEPTVRQEQDGVTLAVSRYRVLPKPEPETGEERLPLPGATAAANDYGPTLRARLYVPAGARYTDKAGGSALAPVLVGKSGKRYPAEILRGGAGSSSKEIAVLDTTWIFPGVDEEPDKLVWELVEKKDPVRLFTFRMTDIPLPGPGALESRRRP